MALPTEAWMQLDTKPYVERALLAANDYIARMKDHAKLAGATPEETAQIRAFLESNPYDNEKIRGAVEAIISDAVKDAEPVRGKRSVIFLAGAPGSKQLLQAAMENSSQPAVKEMRRAVEGAVQVDFQQMKTDFKRLSGESLEPYAKWRPLFSGIDTAINQLCFDHNLSVVNDNTLVPLTQREAEHMKQFIEGLGDIDKKLFAVMLSPEQAAQEARKLGISEDEARAAAKGFYGGLSKLSELVPDMTLFDRDFKAMKHCSSRGPGK